MAKNDPKTNLNDLFARLQRRHNLFACHTLAKMGMVKIDDPSTPIYGEDFGKRNWITPEDDILYKPKYQREYWDRLIRKCMHAYISRKPHITLLTNTHSHT